SVLPEHLVKEEKDYVTHPGNDTLSHILKTEPGSTAQEPEAAPPAVTLPEHITDMTFLKQFTKDDQSKIDKYVHMFIQNAPTLLEKINANWQNRDYPNLKVAAHSLKPQLSYMGVREEVSHIYELEQAA